MLGALIRELLLELGHRLLRLRRAPQRLADEQLLLIPRHPEIDVVTRLRDRRRDLAELVVVGLLEASVDREDQVGPLRRDRLEVDLLAGHHLRIGATQFLLRPRALAPVVAAEEVADAHRYHPEREHRILIV